MLIRKEQVVKLQFGKETDSVTMEITMPDVTLMVVTAAERSTPNIVKFVNVLNQNQPLPLR